MTCVCLVWAPKRPSATVCLCGGLARAHHTHTYTRSPSCVGGRPALAPAAQMVRAFAEKDVEPQALAYNREEKFNIDLFRQCGALGLLGVTVPAEYGGSGACVGG